MKIVWKCRLTVWTHFRALTANWKKELRTAGINCCEFSHITGQMTVSRTDRALFFHHMWTPSGTFGGCSCEPTTCNQKRFLCKINGPFLGCKNKESRNVRSGQINSLTRSERKGNALQQKKPACPQRTAMVDISCTCAHKQQLDTSVGLSFKRWCNERWAPNVSSITSSVLFAVFLKISFTTD